MPPVLARDFLCHCSLRAASPASCAAAGGASEVAAAAMPEEKSSLPLLTTLGVPWFWGGDVEKGWMFMRYNVKPITAWLAPGSWAYGTERIPAAGGAVLASNHLSGIDPPLVGTFSRRALWYMMKAELLDIPLVGEALTWTGAFPVRRGEGDRDSLRKARELVREGHVVGVFVEGTRQRFGYPGPVHAGALTIAMKERVPVIPCGVESFGWSMKNRRACALVYGEPMSLRPSPRQRGRLQGGRRTSGNRDRPPVAASGRGRRRRLPRDAAGRNGETAVATRPRLPSGEDAPPGERPGVGPRAGGRANSLHPLLLASVGRGWVADGGTVGAGSHPAR